MCLVVGMGPALYYDVRSLLRIAQPMRSSDIEELHRIHWIVSVACGGLWVSGMALIYARTGFELSQFSPKLWSKVAVVTVLTANAFVLSTVMIPALSRFKGLRLVDLPVRQLVPMSVCAGVSLSCWVLALALGSSVTLKTAGWDLLLPVLAGGAVLCISGVVGMMFLLRAVVHGHIAGFLTRKDTAQLSLPFGR